MLDVEIFTIHELSAYLKLNEKTARRLTASGDILGLKVDGSCRFRRGDIIEWPPKQVEAMVKMHEGRK